MYAAHVSLAASRPWSGMPKWQYGDIVDLIVFVFKISFLPNYRVNYYDYIIKWCFGMQCNWCVSLHISESLALSYTLAVVAFPSSTF